MRSDSFQIDVLDLQFSSPDNPTGRLAIRADESQVAARIKGFEAKLASLEEWNNFDLKLRVACDSAAFDDLEREFESLFVDTGDLADLKFDLSDGIEVMLSLPGLRRFR